jgi:integrase
MQVQMAASDLCEEGYAKRTVQEAVSILRECLESARVNRMIIANPCVDIKIRDKNTVQERRVLSAEEQRIFLEEIKDEYYFEAFCILLLTGMRIGEFAGLQWQDVDFSNKCIYIKRSMMTGYVQGKKIAQLSTPKTFNSYRTIPFFGETEALLRSWADKQLICKQKMGDRWRADPAHGDLVFTTTVGSPVTRYVIVHAIKKIVDNINLKEYQRAANEHRAPILFTHLHPHAFRHTFATRCFEKGMDPLVVQSIMGHSNYATTISYTHVLDDKIKTAADNIGSFFE